MIYNKLQGVDLGRVHLRQLPRVGGDQQIAWEIRSCFGASLCMHDSDPRIGTLRINVVESRTPPAGVGDVIIEVNPLYAAALCEEMSTLLPIVMGAMTR